jgi:hypothetical protein
MTDWCSCSITDAPSKSSQIALRNQRLGNELVLGKRRLDIANVGGQARVADEALDEIGRLALSAQRLEMPADELLAFCRREIHHQVLGEPGIHEATYATFLQAKELVTVRSFESMARARDLLALCVAEDPTFAAAWAWLGIAAGQL